MTQLAEPHTILWTREMYYAAADGGAFGDRRTELIEGEIVAMSPMTSRHAAIVSLVLDALKAAFGSEYYITGQTPLDVGELSEPEPDIGVYVGTARDYIAQKPTSALLVVEVSETSLRYDRGRKASLYAKAGIADYWIVNLQAGTLEVYRTPVEMDTQRYGYGYKVVSSLTAQDSVSPLALPDVQIAVRDLLP